MEKLWNIKITDNALLIIKVFYKYLFINPKTRITEKVLILLHRKKGLQSGVSLHMIKTVKY